MRAGFVRVTIIHGDGTQQHSIAGEDRCRTAGTKSQTSQPARRSRPNEDRWRYLSQTQVHACKRRSHTSRHAGRCACRRRCDCILPASWVPLRARRHCASSSKISTVHIIPSHDCASTPRTKTSSTVASGAPDAISSNTLFSFASASCARLALSDVAEAPYTANISLLDQLNCRIPLENAAVLQL